MSLVELMVAFSMFTIMALGALTALIQTRKMSENNVAQATAAVIAQGIIEQIHLSGYANVAADATLPLNFAGPRPAGILSEIQSFNLPWASDSTTFTDIGTRADSSNPSSPILGVLLDLDYRSGGNVIRPRRYMPMQVNLQRDVHIADDNIAIILTYRWQPPSGNGAANTPYVTRELRTIRSLAPSY